MARLKQRIWLYMDMTYFRGLSGFRLLKAASYAGAPVLAIAWIAVTLAMGDNTPYSSGPMARVHDHFGEQCSKCHDDSWGGLQSTAAKDRTLNSKCLECHETEMGFDGETFTAWHAFTGERHRASAEADLACASCHREHQGLEDLAFVKDAACTICHEDLGPTLAGDAPEIVSASGLKIESFEPDGGHPEVRLFQGDTPPEDPGTLVFSHHFHLMPGAYEAPDQVLLEAAVQCDDCHRAGETARPWRFAGKTREAHRETFQSGGHSEMEQQGAFMAPIRYALHCAECHPLALDDRLTGSESLAPGTVPHERPEVIRSYLRGQLTAFALKTDRDALRWPDGKVPLPHRIEEEDPDDAARLVFVAQEMAKLERRLYEQGGVCAKCHRVDGQFVAGGELPDIAPPGIPSRWMRHSSFTHARHKADMTCVRCHAQAESPELMLEAGPGSLPRDGAGAVMLPGIESCRECHSEPRTEDGMPMGGVAASCVTCHTFHRPAAQAPAVAGR